MQPIQWYIRRMRVMSPAELAWRAWSYVTGLVDRCLVPIRRRPKPASRLLETHADLDSAGFSVCDIPVGQWVATNREGQGRELYEQLLAEAEKILQHRWSFLNLDDCDLGDTINWNYDYESRKPTPMKYSGRLDYRDSSVCGDCKLVWEPSRGHQLVTLARAYRASGDSRYAAGVAEQIQSWIDQCPYESGMQWRSGLEIGIRLINWVWAIDMIRPSGLVAGEFQASLLNAVSRQMWEVSRKYSRGSSANNHLTGEAAGVFISASYFNNLKNTARYRDESRQILVRAIQEQTCDDGGYREQAVGYHLFASQLFLIAGLAGRWSRQEFPETYWDRLEKMFEFLNVLAMGGQRLPTFGDSDDGYVLDLCTKPRDHRQWLEVAAELFSRVDFKQPDHTSAQTADWLLREDMGKHLSGSDPPPTETELVSKALVESGYYLLQSGRGDDRISLVFDCGQLGLEPLAGHGHADALSFTLRAFGEDVLVDPGTYDYFSYPAQRAFFRSTRAHNTLVVDGQDQAVMQGPFLWGAKPHATCLIWRPSWTGGRVKGRHDGYMSLSDPVMHTREVELDGQNRAICITDEIEAVGQHEIEIRFHLAEQSSLHLAADGQFLIDTGAGGVRLIMDDRLDVELLRAGPRTLDGWVSGGYHRKTPSSTLIGRARIDGPSTFTCRIEIGLPTSQTRELSQELLAASAYGGQL